MVGDPTLIASAAIDELGGPPNAVYNITCLSLPGREIAPFGRKFTGIVTSPYLFLQPMVAAFEYRRSDLPP